MQLEKIYIEASTINEYVNFLNRLNNKEEYIINFLKMFLEDKTHENLLNSINNNDYYLAYTYSHTLKGIALNLGFISLANYCNELCICLKNNDYKLIDRIISHVSKEYYKITNIIKMYE